MIRECDPYYDPKLNSDLMKIIEFISNRKSLAIKVGFTSVQLLNNILNISHSGNMGNTIERSIDPNLAILKLPSIQEIKEVLKDYIEEGSPDYFYSISFKIE